MPAWSESEQQKLMQYNWPGNVRELKNILERAAILQQGSRILPSLLLETLPLNEQAPVASFSHAAEAEEPVLRLSKQWKKITFKALWVNFPAILLKQPKLSEFHSPLLNERSKSTA